MLKSLLLVSAICLFVVAPSPAPTLAAGQAPASPAANARSTAAVQEKAKKIYAVDCALCHGENGNGKTDIAQDMGHDSGRLDRSENACQQVR